MSQADCRCNIQFWRIIKLAKWEESQMVIVFLSPQSRGLCNYTRDYTPRTAPSCLFRRSINNFSVYVYKYLNLKGLFVVALYVDYQMRWSADKWSSFLFCLSVTCMYSTRALNRSPQQAWLLGKKKTPEFRRSLYSIVKSNKVCRVFVSCNLLIILPRSVGSRSKKP